MPTQPPPPPRSTLLHGHCLDVLRTLPDASVDCCITSSPYWGLRDYGVPASVWGGTLDCLHSWKPEVRPATSGSLAHAKEGVTKNAQSATRAPRTGETCRLCGAWRGALGLEPTPDLFVEHLVEVFQEVRRVLKPTGTLWLVLGDSFAGSWGSYGHGRSRSTSKRLRSVAAGLEDLVPPTATVPHLKRKDLVGIPWQVAFALRADGWWLRSDIIWHKPNATPESVTDRPTRAHEFIFLLSKSAHYYYDREAIAEPLAPSSLKRLRQTSFDTQTGGPKDYGASGGGGATNRSLRQAVVNLKGRALPPSGSSGINGTYLRNRRSVWTLSTHSYSGAHFATYPPELIRPCVRAGCPEGGTVLDPFAGAGTTGLVARQEGRGFMGIELNQEYIQLAHERLSAVTATKPGPQV